MLRRAAVWLCCIALLGACAASTPTKPGPNDPSVRLSKLLEQWTAVQASGGSCASGGRKHPYVDCGRIRAAIERLALEFPRDPQILIANAVIAFETRQPDKAQTYLDTLLEIDRVQPNASVLRSRIAIQQGNLPYAQRLLEEQVALSPDHGELREALASVYYLLGRLRQAERALEVAERLGAPSWRIAYHRGLLDEARGDDERAIEHYRRALQGKPDWERAQSRLRGLESERGL